MGRASQGGCGVWEIYLHFKRKLSSFLHIGLIYRFRVYIARPKGRFNLHIPSGGKIHLG